MMTGHHEGVDADVHGGPFDLLAGDDQLDVNDPLVKCHLSI